MSTTSPITFIATVGGQPQVVTFTLELLRAQGFNPTEVILLHLQPRSERLKASMARLRETLAATQATASPPYRLRWVEVQDGHEGISDVTTEHEAQCLLNAVSKLIRELKGQGRTLHCSVAGGRRSMGILMMSVAPLYFDAADALWHLYTPPDLSKASEDGALMAIPPELPPAERPRLVRIPVIPWGYHLPILRQLIYQDDLSALFQPQPLQADEERQRCQWVYEQLTARQREVLELITQGYKREHLGEELAIAKTTLSSHTRAIYDTCRVAWPEIAPDEWDYHLVTAKFQLFFQSRP